MERVENTTIACPIVYGSIAFYLGKKAEEYSTHRWTLYVRGPQDEDLSTFVEKIAFTLHPSFPDPVRVITTPPFEISETGWGEFEAGIRIFFRDNSEQPIDLFHQIRLYPPSTQPQLNSKKPVVSESYDEVLFTSPTRQFYDQLMQYGQQLFKKTPNSTTTTTTDEPTTGSFERKATAFPEHYLPYDDQMDVETLLRIHDHLRQDILEAKQKILLLEGEIVDVKRMKKEAAIAATTGNANNNTANIPTTVPTAIPPSTLPLNQISSDQIFVAPPGLA